MARSTEEGQVAAKPRPGRWLLRLGMFVVLAWAFVIAAPAAAAASELNELSLEGWKLLRETERYQMQVAEKYYREQNWKIAAAEYEKFLELYEMSSGAPYAQLKWSLCQVQLRKQNTAIKEGFQSVIDYWPDSPFAIAAAFYIGRTYKEIGRVKEAKKALREVVSKHPDSLASVLALGDLVDITTIENDLPARVELWQKLTFGIKRTKDSAATCVQASQQLAAHQFREGLLDDGVKALATTYAPAQLPTYVHSYLRTPLSELAAQTETLAKAGKLAEQAVSWFRTQQPTDLSTPENKAQAKLLGLAGLDCLALAKKDDTLDAAYEQLHKLVGPDDEVLGRFAAFKKSRTKWDEARAIYRRYASRTEGLNQVAYSYREQANYQAAIEAYQQCLAQVEPENAVRIKSELAVAYRQAKKIAEAVAVYEDLYNSDKQSPGRWRWEIGVTYREAGQLKEAIGHFRQCDNFPENYKQMAWCHRQLKQFNESITLYNQVAADTGSAPWALLQIAYTREEAGQQEPAIQAFQLVCKRFPTDSHASQAHAHLQTKYKISVTLGGAKDEMSQPQAEPEENSDQSAAVRRDVAEDAAVAAAEPAAWAWRWGALAAGPLLAIFVYMVLGVVDANLPHAPRAVAALGAWMAVWWMTEAAPLEATSLLPLVCLPLWGAYPAKGATPSDPGAFERAATPYADPSIYLFFGGFLIALAIERWGLHRRLALVTLLAFGARPPSLVAGFMAATGFLSLWISNTATAAMMLPIALSVVELVRRRTAGETSLPESDAASEQPLSATSFSEALLLGVAYAASLGGMGTLIGTPTNTIFAGFMQKQGMPVDFAQWMLFAVPISAVFLVLGWLVLTRVAFRIEGGELPGGRELLCRELAELGPLGRGETLVLGLFLLTATLWISRRWLTGWLAPVWPGASALDDYTIAIGAAVVLFLIPVDVQRGQFLLDWRSAERLPWGVLLLFGGGLSLAEAMDATGLDDWLGGRMTLLGGLPTPLLVLAVVAIVIAFSELASNVATATALLPLLLQVAKGLHLEPRLLLVPAILAASCGFMLPVATPPNAIAFGTGRVRLRTMLRVGLLFDLLGLALIPLAMWLWGGTLGK